MKKWAYYNDNDPYVCEWVRNLIKAKLITDGEVDERPIEDVLPADVVGFARVHFFCGIAGWEHALNLAGYDRWDLVTWTGSCPCQPFSCAGKQRGEKDERHLWPHFRRLITLCKPPTVFGEQVAGRLGREWLNGVRADLEALGYEVGAADLCAAGVGAPHIRQRLYWVAVASHHHGGRGERGKETGAGQDGKRGRGSTGGGEAGWLADGGGAGLAGRSEQSAREERQAVERGGDAGGVGKSESKRDDQITEIPGGAGAEPDGTGSWSDSIPILCRDGKIRRIPVEPRFFPLAHRVPGRVGRLRAYGNAIVPQVAAAFIGVFMDAERDRNNRGDRK